MEPPVSMDKTPQISQFKAPNFEDAYTFAKGWIKDNRIEGTQILMLAQLDR
jgi:hypothetical protein